MSVHKQGAEPDSSPKPPHSVLNFFRALPKAFGTRKPLRGQEGGKSEQYSTNDNTNMGQEGSSPLDESIAPKTLAGRTLDGLAEYIKSGRVRKIVVMSGAGISTSAGIPDFRSPDTGLYANLARLNLPYAEAVFDISYFRDNPEPFYTLAHELYPGKYRPTITHSFIRLLHDKGLLLKHFTQNIDCLDREAGVPDDKIVEAHGSFARQSCIECHTPYPEDDIRGHINNKTIPRCITCMGLVKPEIVFFGEQLPAEFFKNRMMPAQADLVIVLGTSLTVQPFASLPNMTKEETPRVLINKEKVGNLGSQADDVLLLGDCDDGVRKLAEACGWLDELERLWSETASKDAVADTASKSANEEKKTKDEALEDEINNLTKEVDETLNLSKWHEEKVRSERMPRQAPIAKAGGESTQSSKLESADGNLNHVFVSAQREPALSTTLVVAQSGPGDSKPSDKTDADDPQTGGTKG